MITDDPPESQWDTYWTRGSLLLCKRDQGGLIEQGFNAWPLPWPATHSDGEKLLKLLGVLE